MAFIVVYDLADFPATALEPLGLEAKHPDDFLLEAHDLAPGAIAAAVSEQAAALKSPPKTVSELLDTLRHQGLPLAVSRLREAFGSRP